MPPTILRTTRSAAETEALAESIARRLLPGDRITLEGDLGAGKTTFVRGLVRGLLHPDPRAVSSPTFAIHHRYEGGRLVLDHVDLYRLRWPVDPAREGLDTVFDDPSTVLCCEWPERLGHALSGLSLAVTLEAPTEVERRIACRAERSALLRFFPEGLS